MKRNKALAGLALGLFAMSGVAFGQTVTFGTPVPASGPAGTNFTVAVNFTAGGSTAAYQVDVVIPPEFVTVTPTNADGVCAIGNPSPGTFRVSDFDAALNPLPSGTACTLAVTVGAAVPDGTYSFSECTTAPCQPPTASDGVGMPVATYTVDYGPGFIVAPAPVDAPPTLTGAFVPNGAAAGNVGQTVNVGTIDFTVTAPATGTGTGSITCTDANGATAPALTITPANQVGLTATVQDATVGCTLTDTAQNGQVQCVLVNGGTQLFDVACPAGTVVPPPPTPLIVPASSFWSQLSLVGLLAALGLLVVAFRRNH